MLWFFYAQCIQNANTHTERTILENAMNMNTFAFLYYKAQKSEWQSPNNKKWCAHINTNSTIIYIVMPICFFFLFHCLVYFIQLYTHSSNKHLIFTFFKKDTKNFYVFECVCYVIYESHS